MVLYLFLLFTIFLKLFNIITLIHYLKHKRKRKWLWFFFILFFNVINFWLVMDTNQVGVSFFNLSFLGFSYVKYSQMASWVLSFNLPFGAIIWWLYYKVKYFNSR